MKRNCIVVKHVTYAHNYWPYFYSSNGRLIALGDWGFLMGIHDLILIKSSMLTFSVSQMTITVQLGTHIWVAAISNLLPSRPPHWIMSTSYYSTCKSGMANQWTVGQFGLYFPSHHPPLDEAGSLYSISVISQQQATV